MKQEEIQNLVQTWRMKELALEDAETRHAARLLFLDLCSKDERFKLLSVSKAAEDPEIFFDYFVYTFNPKEDVSHQPMILYEYEREIVHWVLERIKKREDGLVEKSREMGVTWIVLGIIDWLWLFKNGFTALLGSEKEKKTDNRDVDSLFGRLEYILRHLPMWMRPMGFDFDKHRTHLKIVNPENQNSILGDSANPNFGRQGRYSVIFLDEFAFWEYSYQSWKSAQESADTRICVSTPSEVGGRFKKLRFSNEIPVMTVHWSRHPFKNQEWYEKKKVGKLAHEIAQELDINYDRAVMGKVYDEWSGVRWGTYAYDPNLPLFVSWDYGRTNDTAMIWYQKKFSTNQVFLIDCYRNSGHAIDFYIPFVTGQVDSRFTYTEEELSIIKEHSVWPRGMHFGDPAGRQRSQVSNTSVMEVLKSHGIIVNTNDFAIEFMPRRDATKRLIPRLFVNKNERTEYLGDCISNARYPQRNEDSSQATTPIVNPIHDWTADYRTSLEYFAVNEPMRARQSQDRVKKKKVGRLTAVPYLGR